MAGMADGAEIPDPALTHEPRHHGLRWSGALVLLLIAALLVPVALVARYARGELLNTDRYVATVAPLAGDPAVQSALADRVTNEIVGRIDLPGLIQQATDALTIKAAPALGALITGPVSDWLTSFVHDHVQRFLASPTFQTLWTEVNRLAHQGVDTILTGRQGGAVSTSGDRVVLDIGPIVDTAKQALVDDGFSLAAKVPSVDVQFTLFQSDQLPKAQRAVRLLNRTATWLPWLILGCFALALWLAPNRRRAALAGLVMTGVLLIAMLIANPVARRAYGDQLTAKGLNEAAGLAVYDDVVRFLITAVTTALAACLVAAVWLWLAGPGRAGTAVRGVLGRGSGWIAGALGWRRSGFTAAVDRYRGWVFVVLGVAGFVVLLRNPTVSTVVWTSLVALALAGLFAVFHRLPSRRVTAA